MTEAEPLPAVSALILQRHRLGIHVFCFTVVEKINTGFLESGINRILISALIIHTPESVLEPDFVHRLR